MKTERKVNIDIIMLSKFGKRDGGRETWLYLFLPMLLQNDKIGRINIFGFRTIDQEDNTKLLHQLDPLKSNRIQPYIVVSDKHKYPKIISFHSKLKKLLSSTEIPVSDYAIGVGGMFENTIISRFKRFKDSKRVLWLRNIFIHEKAYVIPKMLRGFFIFLEKRMLSKIDILIANGDDTQKHYAKYGFNVATIKNAIDPIKWNMAPIEKSDILNIAYIGRLSEVKGILSYIELAKSIKQKRNGGKFNFHIVGDANMYLNEVKKLQKEGVIIYHGAMENPLLPQFLKQIQVCVALTFVSSQGGGAGLSNALLEQMAAGKIILAWDNDAFNQILTQDCAYIIKQYSVKGLVKAILEIYEHQDTAIKKSIKAKEVVQPYTIKNHVLNFEGLLKL